MRKCLSASRLRLGDQPNALLFSAITLAASAINFGIRTRGFWRPWRAAPGRAYCSRQGYMVVKEFSDKIMDPGRGALLAREFELFHTIPRETIVLYPPRVVQILKNTGAPIAEACSVVVGGMAAAVEAVARMFRELGRRPDMDL